MIDALLVRIRRAFCSHRVFIEDIRRLAPDLVEAKCHRCGQVLMARYGLALDADLEQKGSES